jgi:hypothetical protein
MSVTVQNHGLDSVPGPAENIGQPAVDKKKGKVWDNADEAVKDIQSGSLLLSAGKSVLGAQAALDRWTEWWLIPQALDCVVPPRLSSRPCNDDQS